MQELSEPMTIHQVLIGQASQRPDEIAILAPSRQPLTYSGLKAQIDQTMAALVQMGVGRGNRVAIVLPNGPEMFVCFLSVSSFAISAPLNPSYGQSEFEAYFQELSIDTLIVQAGMASPSRLAAQTLGIPIVELEQRPGSEAGTFVLHSGRDFWQANRTVKPENGQPARGGQPGAVRLDDIALIMQTSGTTSKPKIVPLTHRNLWTSVNNIKASLDLQAGDRCLNVMPLFHSHGLVGTCLTSIAAGSSVVCVPGFDAMGFFAWLEEFQPTWYSAVPTIHQAVLSVAAQAPHTLNTSLRFIRSTSAALPVAVLKELETLFRVPVIEAYATLETLQVTSTPFSPNLRKLGSAGCAVGTELAVMDASGHILPANTIGEIVVKGPNVIQGYENNPLANQNSFSDGWFRTGDQGYLDDEGHLFLTGRLKEMINRGGETISPREIDEVLLEHPSIQQALAFAVPHPRLGEDIAAAIVLKPNRSATEKDMREFVANRLAAFKVPSQVVFVADIPKGPTGKLQRIGLAQVLEAQLKAEFISPRTPLEETLADLWREILGLNQIGIFDNFFALGGDSLQAVALLAKIEQTLDQKLPPDTIFRNLTIAELAEVLTSPQQRECRSPLVAIKPNGKKLPLFAVHDVTGELNCYQTLVKYLKPDQPFYGLCASELDHRELRQMRLEDLAATYLQEIQTVQPHGPYLLTGYSFGGLIAFEIAQQLRQQGQPIALLVLLDTFAQNDLQPFSMRQKITRHIRYSLKAGPRYVVERFMKRSVADSMPASSASQFTQQGSPASVSDKKAWLIEILGRAKQPYLPGVYDGAITFFQPANREEFLEWCNFDPVKCWQPRTKAVLDLYSVPGGHAAMLGDPHVKALAQTLNVCLEKAHRQVMSHSKLSYGEDDPVLLAS
jgi:acyl-CoA synthetase (AMP-forming)/AMP-acid ligase II/thioesterase domain-containing protein